MPLKRFEPALPATQAPPIEWPVVRIGGYELEVKYDFRGTYRASKAGVDFLKFGSSAGIGEKMDLFAVLVAPLFEAEDQPAPSGVEWAAHIESMEHFKTIVDAMDRAFNLAQPPKKPAAAPLAPQTETPGNAPE